LKKRDGIEPGMKGPALKKKVETAAMSRRGFLRWSALVGSSVAASKSLAGGFRRRDPRHSLVEAAQSAAEERMIRTGCPSHNCGGRCLLQVFVRDGVIVRIETDDRPGDTVADPQLRACVRGRAYQIGRAHV
jgi:anaerobic dimethyl sulfoxide reductase subunit A